MADRSLIVKIIGDDRSFQQALTRSTASANKFGRDIGSRVSVADQFAPLLKDVRGMRAEADVLSKRLNTLDDGLGDVGTSARGASGSLGGIAARAGGAAIAVGAIYQASRHLSDALKQTGVEAFTAEGRIRNFGAALLSGDIVGGIQALVAVPQHFADIGISAREAGRNLGDFDRAAEGLGGSFITIRNEAQLAAAAILEVDAATRTALNSALALRGQNGQPIPFGNFGAQTPGGPQFTPQLGGTPTPDNSALEREIALERARRQGNLKAESKALQEQLKHAHYLVTVTKGTGDLYRDRVREEQRVKGLLDANHDQIVAGNESAKATASATADRARSAREQAAADAVRAAAEARSAREITLQNNVAKAALTKRKSDDISTTKVLIDYLKSVVASTSGVEQAQARAKITAARKSLAAVLKPEKKSKADDVADTQRQVAELRLANNVAQAGLTKRLDDDRDAINKQIAYYEGLTKNTAQLEASRKQFVLANAKGLVKKGNLDILHRPDVRNPDGTHSSVFTTSFGIDQGEVLVPRVLGKGKKARVVSEQEALRHFKETGENLGIFNTIKAANAYADRLHKQQAGLLKTGLKVTDLEREQYRQRLIAARAALASLKAEGPLTKTTSLNANKILKGLTVGRDTEKELRARLSSFNSAGVALAGNRRPTGKFVVGGQTIVVENHNTTMLDGDVVGRNVSRSQQKTRRRNPKQKRGPNSGV